MSWNGARLTWFKDAKMKITIKPSLTEEMVLNQKWMGKIKGWRRYRIEYGFEDETPEGIVYLPAHINADEFENYLIELVNRKE